MAQKKKGLHAFLTSTRLFAWPFSRDFDGPITGKEEKSVQKITQHI